MSDRRLGGKVGLARELLSRWAFHHIFSMMDGRVVGPFQVIFTQDGPVDNRWPAMDGRGGLPSILCECVPLSK